MRQIHLTKYFLSFNYHQSFLSDYRGLARYLWNGVAPTELYRQVALFIILVGIRAALQLRVGSPDVQQLCLAFWDPKERGADCWHSLNVRS